MKGRSRPTEQILNGSPYPKWSDSIWGMPAEIIFDHPPTVYEVEEAIRIKCPGAIYGTPAGDVLGDYYVSVFPKKSGGELGNA